MGLISRVSSRTYRFLQGTIKCHMTISENNYENHFYTNFDGSNKNAALITANELTIAQKHLILRSINDNCESLPRKTQTRKASAAMPIKTILANEGLPYSMSPVSIYSDDLCSYHNFKHLEKLDEDFDEHVECPSRCIKTLESILGNEKLLIYDQNPKTKELMAYRKINLRLNAARLAKKEEILLGHKEEYYNWVQSTIHLNDKELYDRTLQSDSLYLSRLTELSASVALGTCLQAAEDLFDNINLKAAYCLTRPPGHHAYKNKGSGFCIYNNAAIVAKHMVNYSKKRKNKDEHLRRILILDWDVHHGNGTQDITYDDNHIMFVSLHRSDRGMFYPGKGDEMGSENLGGETARGLNINIPFNNYDYNHSTKNYDIFD